MNCPNCGSPDPGSGRFCIHCGTALPQPVLSPTDPTLVESSSQDGPLTASAPTRAQPDAPPGAGPTTVAGIGAVSIAPASIWGPFAGYGTRGRHVGWLLDDLGERAEELRQAVTERFRHRSIPGAMVSPRILTAKGVQVQQRPYYLVQRNRVTTGLYLARFGKDVYVSQVSYLKSPISVARVVALLAVALFAVVYPSLLAGASDQLGVGLGGVSGIGDLLGALCCLGPLYLVSILIIGLAAMFSLYKFVTDKDILAALRVTPNEFDQDDLIALEKAVEQTVREAMDHIGIDSKLMPPAARYGLRERII